MGPLPSPPKRLLLIIKIGQERLPYLLWVEHGVHSHKSMIERSNQSIVRDARATDNNSNVALACLRTRALFLLCLNLSSSATTRTPLKKLQPKRPKNQKHKQTKRQHTNQFFTTSTSFTHTKQDKKRRVETDACIYHKKEENHFHFPIPGRRCC